MALESSERAVRGIKKAYLPVPLLLVRESRSKLVLGDSLWLTKLIKGKQIVVRILISIPSIATTICLRVGDHLSPVPKIRISLSLEH